MISLDLVNSIYKYLDNGSKANFALASKSIYNMFSKDELSMPYTIDDDKKYIINNFNEVIKYGYHETWKTFDSHFVKYAYINLCTREFDIAKFPTIKRLEINACHEKVIIDLQKLDHNMELLSIYVIEDEPERFYGTYEIPGINDDDFEISISDENEYGKKTTEVDMVQYNVKINGYIIDELAIYKTKHEYAD